MKTASPAWGERQDNMYISYKPLWHTLIERNMRKEDLRLAAGLTTNMIANMGKGKHISMETLTKICEAILKLMCYYHVSIQWKGWMDSPSPQTAEEAISTIMDNHSGWLNVLLPKENALVVFEWDCLNLSIFNPSEKIQLLMQKISASEGLSFWKPDR